MDIKKQNAPLSLLLIFMLNLFSQLLYSQEIKEPAARPYTFNGAVTVQSKGISTIPNLTLGKPAIIFDMRMGRKLTFEPQFRFSLEGKPWAMVFWWRYYGTIGDKFTLTFHTNYSLAYKPIISYTATGESQDLIRTTRYLVGAFAPNYQVNKYIGIGAYIFYNRGIEKFIARNTWMLSFRPGFSNIPITKDISARFGPEIYLLKMDDKNGWFLNSTLSISKKNFPLSVSALVNRTIDSDIPADYSFLWNVGLSYSFSKKLVETI